MQRTYRALLLLLPLLSLSCATAVSQRRAELRRGLDQARLSRSPAELWPELLRFLHERGFPLAGDDPAVLGLSAQSFVGKLFSPGYQTRVRADGSRILETNLEQRSRTRVRAEAKPTGDGSSILRVTLLTQSDLSPAEFSEGRDEELELALLERLDPVAAARALGKEAPPAASPAARDGWAPVRHLVGAWSGQGPGGLPVRWRFDFAGEGQFLELRGTPLLFAGAPGAHAGAREEMGRISRDAAAAGFTWRQFTSGGQVDQYRSEPGLPGALVFLAAAPESLPGGRVQLTLGRDGDDELVAILRVAEAGKELAVAGEVRLRRVRSP